MGVVKGLQNINKHVADEDAKYGGGDGARWFKLVDKQAVKVLFLQELDEDSKNYSAKNGLGFMAVEHNNPASYQRKAVCSLNDEGVCWACEQHNKDWKAGWKQKSRLYINVLVDDGLDDPYVAILSQGNGPKSLTPSILEQAGELGTITDKWFKVKRIGAGKKDTSYLLTALGASDKNVEDYDLIDLDAVLRNVPYAEQRAHYLDGVTGEDESTPNREIPADLVNAQW